VPRAESREPRVGDRCVPRPRCRGQGLNTMDLDPAAEDEEAERQLEDHNEAMDARQALLGVGVTHLDPVDLEDFVASRTGTATDSTSPPASTTASSGGGSRKRSKVWNNFDELTNLVNGKLKVA
jgi:cytochrome c556